MCWPKDFIRPLLTVSPVNASVPGPETVSDLPAPEMSPVAVSVLPEAIETWVLQSRMICVEIG
jgi:hypothetical protein